MEQPTIKQFSKSEKIPPQQNNDIKYTFCRICEVLCGLKIEVENNKVTRILPDRDHVATQGFACPKGVNQHKIYDSPDRIKYPMKRIGNEWKRISWNIALQEIGTKVAQIRKEYDPNAIAMYVGTAAGFSALHPVFAQGFMTGIGSVNMFSSSTQDCSNKFAVASEMYGFPFTQPFPDLENINCLIIVGANPLISKWSFLQVPDPAKKLKSIVNRGGKLYVIDPRKTETAQAAGEHIFIQPGTDVFFYLSFLNEVMNQNGVQEDRVARFMTGFDELKKLAAWWSASKTEDVTGISSTKLERMVCDFLQADGAALYCSTGVNMGKHGALAFWLQECINAITGNLDRVGGTLVSKGIIDFPKFGSKRGLLMRPNRSRVGNCRSVNDGFPGGILADEILTPGNEKIRALFVTGGNPLITMADSNRLHDAFQELDLLVTLDILPTETAALAHYVLPCTTPLERPDLPFIFPLMLGLQMRPYLQATEAMINPEGEQRDEASIYLDLCRNSKVNLFGSGIAQNLLQLVSSKRIVDGFALYDVPQKGIMNFLLRICNAPGFKKIMTYPHGLLRGGHRTNFLNERLVTKDKKVNLAPEILMKASENLEAEFQEELKNSGKYKLITKRAVKTHNSWTHNFEPFVKEPEHTNYLYIHPEDALELGLTENELADVTSDTGSVRLPVRLSSDLLRKTVALPHGWGHQQSGLRVARKTRGVNVNILAASGKANIDPISGMSQLTGISVEITKAKGEQDRERWSGITLK
jgi:anaerobic selenocysteine-containing dehydrogenase